jgi:serine/threonine protein kinase
LPDGQHRNSVLELAQLSPNLKELHTIILTDFDSLQNAQYDSEIIWNMITLYVDKLHSVELLIIEELECSQPIIPTASSLIKRVTSTSSLSGMMRVTSTSSLTGLMMPPSAQQAPQAVPTESSLSPAEEHKLAVDQVLEHIFPPTNGHDLLSQMESMSGDEIKKRVLEVLKAEGCASETSSTSSEEQHQYSAAMNLKDNMQKALVTNPLNRAASKEWDISIYEIKFNRRIGQGASATTYLATWTGQNVAVKVASITQFGLEGWRTEVATLQRLHHPNVIRLLGSIYHENPLTHCLVLEYCNAGDLATALKYPTPRTFFFHVAISIANAMTYLHSRNVIHRDLKPGNVLCDGNIASGNFAVKVTDFGIATDAGNSSINGGGSPSTKTKNLTGETGTYRWMAPEVIRHEAYSSRADVYSFAIMVWQFLTHEEPFLDECAAEAARLVAMEQERPPMPPGTPKAIVDLIQVNWSNQPSERWQFEKVGESLKAIQSSMAADEKMWLEASDGHPVYVYDEPETEDIQPNDKKGAKLGQGKHHDLRPPPRRGSSLLSNFFGSHKKSGKK